MYAICILGTHADQKRVLGSLGLELKKVVGHNGGAGNQIQVCLWLTGFEVRTVEAVLPCPLVVQRVAQEARRRSELLTSQLRFRCTHKWKGRRMSVESSNPL